MEERFDIIDSDEGDMFFNADKTTVGRALDHILKNQGGYL